MRSQARILPALFIDRLRKIIPVSKFDSVLNSFTATKPATFRVNILKTSPREIKRCFESNGFQLKNVSWYEDAFILKTGRLRELEKTEIYQKGEIYVQNLSSMVPAIVLNPQAGETILDLAAAPGGKTAQMSCMMNGEGKIIANENSQIRFEKMGKNISIQEVPNCETVLSYGESFGNKYFESFDRVLVDAPCTAEGRFLTSEPSSYRYWNLSRVREASKLQKKLIVSGLKALKPNGVLVYSTCTMAPEENEEVVQYALMQFKNMIHVEPVNLNLSNRMMGLKHWEGKEFDPTLKQTVRILPTYEMEGFFVARIRKNKN